MMRQGAATACMLLALAGCAAQTQEVQEAPSAFAGSTHLRPSSEEPGAWTYIAPNAQLSAYRRFILDPPRIFRGEGSGYGDLSEADIQQIAQMFVDETRAALGPTYPIVTQPGPDAARLRYTLIAVSRTVPYVSTATRVIPIGAAINLLKGGAGGAGTLTGSVTYGIEAFDSQGGQLVAAAVRELTPGAFDLGATLGTMETARAVAKDAAAKLRARLDSLQRAG
ncbi:DUF3313 domain-containing protein [Benzoatithermus flavus]|uniref:DUF3313 domain-containing protein n=1 Tax=Benzoatithermus flavus TaxID=3108223 RepID=A0ABU8XTZ3_9PROT